MGSAKRQGRAGQVKSFEPTATPRDERGSSVTPNTSSPSKFKTQKVGRSESGHVKVIKTFKNPKNVASGKKGGAATKASKAKLAKQQITHDPKADQGIMRAFRRK